MKTNNIFAVKTPYSYLKLAIWIFLVLFAGRFIVKDALPYFGLNEEVFRRFWSK